MDARAAPTRAAAQEQRASETMDLVRLDLIVPSCGNGVLPELAPRRCRRGLRRHGRPRGCNSRVRGTRGVNLYSGERGAPGAVVSSCARAAPLRAAACPTVRSSTRQAAAPGAAGAGAGIAPSGRRARHPRPRSLASRRLPRSTRGRPRRRRCRCPLRLRRATAVAELLGLQHHLRRGRHAPRMLHRLQSSAHRGARAPRSHQVAELRLRQHAPGLGHCILVQAPMCQSSDALRCLRSRRRLLGAPPPLCPSSGGLRATRGATSRASAGLRSAVSAPGRRRAGLRSAVSEQPKCLWTHTHTHMAHNQTVQSTHWRICLCSPEHGGSRNPRSAFQKGVSVRVCWRATLHEPDDDFVWVAFRCARVVVSSQVHS